MAAAAVSHEPQQHQGNAASNVLSTDVQATLMPVARARRRPARYSPELVSGGGGGGGGSVVQQTAVASLLAHLSAADLLLAASSGTAGVAESGATEENAASAAQQQQQQQDHMLLQQAQQELEDSGDGHQQQQQALANGDMSPAAAVAPATLRRARHHRTKRKYKKRQTASQLSVQLQQIQQHGPEEAAKRPRVANVLLENEMLIDEIRERKALWMRTHEQHHSSLLTTPLWEEVAKALDTTQETVRRRWKSLKDHYRRELKKSMTDPTAPPSTWPYYKKMRFMKSQMFVSLRQKNGEDHLEILSDDEEDINNQWNGQIVRSKVENGSDTMDDYELAEYNEMVKYEQHLQQLGHEHEMDGVQEEEGEEEEDEQQQQHQQEGEEEQQDEQEEMSPNPSLQDQEEHRLSAALQQQAAELSEFSNMSTMRQQPVITNEMTTMTTIGGLPAAIVVTTTASSLSAAMQQRAAAEQQQRQQHLNAAMQTREISGEVDEEEEEEEVEDDNLAEMNARHTALQQQRAEINGRITAIQRNAEMTALQQRNNITAMHERAEMTALRQRAELQQQQQQQQQRNGGHHLGSNGVEIDDERGCISDDYHFFMSLMPHVRHFTSLQKLKVRNRIQQIIIEEASNCPQYDPLANC